MTIMLAALWGGADGFVLFVESVLPVGVLLFILYDNDAHTMPLALLLEMFWTGACCSFVAGYILETIGMRLEAKSGVLKGCHIEDPAPALHNETSLQPTGNATFVQPTGPSAQYPSLFCDYKFILFIVVVVAMSEELCKFAIAMSRVRLETAALPHMCVRWWRVVETPYELALVGVAAAAGYVRTIKRVPLMFARWCASALPASRT